MFSFRKKNKTKSKEAREASSPLSQSVTQLAPCSEDSSSMDLTSSAHPTKVYGRSPMPFIPTSATPSLYATVSKILPNSSSSHHHKEKRKSRKSHSEGFVLLGLLPDYLGGKIHLPMIKNSQDLDTAPSSWKFLATLHLQRRQSEQSSDFGIAFRKWKILSRHLSEDGQAQEFIQQILVMESSLPKEGTANHCDKSLWEDYLYPGDLVLDVSNDMNIPSSMPSVEEVLHHIRDCSKDSQSLDLLVFPLWDVLEMHACVYEHYTSEHGKFRKLLSTMHESNNSESSEWRMSTSAVLNNKRAWLAYRDGYTPVKLLSSTSIKQPHSTVAADKLGDKLDSASSMNGEFCEVELEHNGQRLHVDPADINMMNDSSYDLCSNVAHLPYLNESSVIHVLRQRYGSNMWMSYADKQQRTLLTVHPLLPSSVQLSHAQALFGDRMMQCYQACSSASSSSNGSSVLHTSPQRRAAATTASSSGDKESHRTTSEKSLPPHVFSLAQTALMNLQMCAREKTSSTSSSAALTHNSKSAGMSAAHPIVCLLGASGSGKSFYARHIVHYWLKTLANTNDVIQSEHVQSMFLILDAFQCARTLLNTQASRCARVITLDLVHNNSHSTGQHRSFTLRSIQIQLVLLERTRVVRRPEGEPTFHIFYYMLAGLPAEEKSALFLDHLDEPNLFLTPLQREEEHKQAARSWQQLLKAVSHLSIHANEWNSICQLLAVIYHLGRAGANDASSNIGADFLHPPAAQRAATLLGCTCDYLKQRVFCLANKGSSGMTQWTPILSSDKSGSVNALSLLESFVTGLYTEIVQIVLHLLNRFFNPSHRNGPVGGGYSLSVLDPPGFQNSASLGRTTGATYEDLCYNFVHENLLQSYQNVCFHTPKKIFEKENIHSDWMSGLGVVSPEGVIQLIGGNMEEQELTSSHSASASLLTLLDDAVMSGATNAHLIKQLDQFYKSYKTQHRNRADRLMTRVTSHGQFSLKHCSNSVSLLYNPIDWLKNCREYPTAKNAQLTLLDCGNEWIRSLAENSQSSQNALIRRSHTRSAMNDGVSRGKEKTNGDSTGWSSASMSPSSRPMSLSMQVKAQVKWLLQVMRRSDSNGSNAAAYFVHCLLPVYNAGLCELRDSDCAMAPRSEDCAPKVGLLRQQLRGIQLLPLLKAERQMKLLPKGISFTDFRLLYEPLEGRKALGQQPQYTIEEEKQLVKDILHRFEVSPSQFELGSSQVFLAPGVQQRLEESTLSGLENIVIALQSLCRGYLAMKKSKSLWMRQQAVLCIQKNASIYMNLRRWPWWRLYQYVRPLIPVYRTDADLQKAQQDLEQCRVQLTTVEEEKNALKQQCSDLQNEIHDLKEDLRESQHNNLYAGNKLFSEREQAMLWQQEIQELKTRLHATEREKIEIEHELVLLRATPTPTNNSRPDQQQESHSTDEDDDELLKERYHRNLREMEVLKRQLRQMEDDHIQYLEDSKRNQDKKMNELQEENEQLCQELGVTRRRQSKVQQDLVDLQSRLEHEQNRTMDLERRQKKFDSEMSRVQNAASEETKSRDRLQREKDEILAEKFRSDRLIQDLRVDLEVAQDKVKRLTQELSATSTGPDDGKGGLENEMSDLKRTKVELEQRIQELEEEVDENAAQADSMKQARLRAEINLEKLRQQNSKLLEERDLEIEEVRSSMLRRVRQVEQQLEESREERQSLLKDRRELDQKLSEMMGRDTQRDLEKEKKLRKELKKHRALLKDAYLTIDGMRNSQPDDKTIVKQLRDQLEDAETQRDAALRHKRQMVADLEESRAQLEDVSKLKQELEERCSALRRERDDMQHQLEEQEEEMNEVMRKYRALVSQQSADSSAMAAQGREMQDLLEQREQLRRQLNDAEERVRSQEASQVNRSELTRLESRCRELEGKLDLEVSAKNRLQHQNDRFREQLDQLEEEKDHLLNTEASERDNTRRLQRQLRELKEQVEELESRCTEAERRKNEAVSQVEQVEEHLQASQNELKKTQRRVQDLQNIIDDSLNRDSGSDSGDSDAAGSSADRANKFLLQVDQVLKRRSSVSDILMPSPRRASVSATLPLSLTPSAASQRRHSEAFVKPYGTLPNTVQPLLMDSSKKILSTTSKLLPTLKSVDCDDGEDGDDSSVEDNSSASTLSLNEQDHR